VGGRNPGVSKADEGAMSVLKTAFDTKQRGKTALGERGTGKGGRGEEGLTPPEDLDSGGGRQSKPRENGTKRGKKNGGQLGGEEKM